MNSKQKGWLLVGPVIFSFAMAMTTPVIRVYFIRFVNSDILAISDICAHDCYCMYDEKLKCDNGIATWLKQEYTGVSDYD